MNAAISTAILAKVATGLSIEQAIDAILGEGTFQQIAADLYNSFNA